MSIGLRPFFVRAALFALACLAAPVAVATTPESALSPSWMPRAEGALLRVVTWNVSRHAFFREAADRTAILEAIDADILLLDEMPVDVDAETIAEALPGGAARWHVVYGTTGGGHQRASIASRWPLQRVDAFDRLHYADAQIADWSARAEPKFRDRLLADAPGGLAAAGAVLALDGRRVLLVGTDFQCCGDAPGSWEEDRRRAEAGLLREAIDAVVGRGGIEAVLLGGDLNNVGGDAPVAILRGTPASAWSLVDVPAARPGGGPDWTWDGRGTPFASKRIDYVMHSAALRALQAAVFDSESIDASMRESLGLREGASGAISAHRPVVVDLGWR